MKLGSFILATLILSILLTGCKNRIEEYEPYSAFDDRMAAAEKGAPAGPDDQMPAGVDEEHYASADEQQGFFNNEARETTKMASSSGASQGDEVPFTSSEAPKHATNIGAL
jgi:hypothetical protein